MHLCRTIIQPRSIPLLRNLPSQPPLPLFLGPPRFFFKPQPAPASLLLKPESLHGIRCISSHSHGVREQEEPDNETVSDRGGDFGSFKEEEEMAVVEATAGGELAEQGLCKQMEEIVKFAGPASGLWISRPLMSLIDTAVIGQGSSIELAALGMPRNGSL